MKEQLRLFWSQGTKEAGRKFLLKWIFEAMTSGIDALRRVGRTLLYQSDGLLNYFEFRINNGIAEGTINKVKVLKRRG